MFPERFEIDLGEWQCGGRDYRIRLVVQKHRLTNLMTRALKSPYGRAMLEAGAIALLARRVEPRREPEKTDGAA